MASSKSSKILAAYYNREMTWLSPKSFIFSQFCIDDLGIFPNMSKNVSDKRKVSGRTMDRKAGQVTNITKPTDNTSCLSDYLSRIQLYMVDGRNI